MNHRLFSLLLFVIFSTHFIRSQENFIPGSIVTLKGDTLFGNVDYQSWVSNPATIRFKSDKDEKVLSYGPKELLSFKVNADVYVAAEVRLETSSVRMDELQDGVELHFIKDTVFLQSLFQGTKSLYLYKGIKGKNQFFIKEDTTYELLLYKKYVAYDLSMRNVRELKKYVGQLILYLSDCPSLFNQINQTSYKQTSLVNLFNKYFEKNNQQIDYHKKKETFAVSFGVVGGVAQNTLKFNSLIFAELAYTNYKPTYSINPGLFIEFSHPRSLGKWSSYNELLYAPTHYEGFYEDNLYRVYTEFRFNYLKMTNMIRYQLPLKTIHLFVNCGLSNGYFFGEKNEKRSESKIYDDRIYFEKAIDETKKFEQGLVFGVGLKEKRLSIECRHEFGNGMSSYYGLNSSTGSSKLLVSYAF